MKRVMLCDFWGLVLKTPHTSALFLEPSCQAVRKPRPQPRSQLTASIIHQAQEWVFRWFQPLATKRVTLASLWVSQLMPRSTVRGCCPPIMPCAKCRFPSGIKACQLCRWFGVICYGPTENWSEVVGEQMRYMHTAEYYPGIKRRKCWHTRQHEWIPKDLMLSKSSWTQRARTVWVCLSEILEQGKSMEDEYMQ